MGPEQMRPNTEVQSLDRVEQMCPGAEHRGLDMKRRTGFLHSAGIKHQ